MSEVEKVGFDYRTAVGIANVSASGAENGNWLCHVSNRDLENLYISSWVAQTRVGFAARFGGCCDEMESDLESGRIQEHVGDCLPNISLDWAKID